MIFEILIFPKDPLSAFLSDGAPSIPGFFRVTALSLDNKRAREKPRFSSTFSLFFYFIFFIVPRSFTGGNFLLMHLSSPRAQLIVFFPPSFDSTLISHPGVPLPFLKTGPKTRAHFTQAPRRTSPFSLRRHALQFSLVPGALMESPLHSLLFRFPLRIDCQKGPFAAPVIVLQ